ncbi:glycosyltransferase [Flavihumibacter sp. R14]|nr:glycosyltransferase [Flavihumibacter soli]
MISVIIPTLNEQDQIRNTIHRLREAADKYPVEIIIVDGGSSDQTLEEARKAGADAVFESEKRGRAAQMNYGALKAHGNILYFLHADTTPPDKFPSSIVASVLSNKAGCFRLSFDHSHWFLKACCWLTRFDMNFFRFGDQSLFILDKSFQAIGGFNEKLYIMEDQEIIYRLKRVTGFKVVPEPVVTSARKYVDNGIYKTQSIFFLLFLLYKIGVSQPNLAALYRRLIPPIKN